MSATAADTAATGRAVTVSYASIIADDIVTLCSFYGTVLELEEVEGSTDIFRGLSTGNEVVLAFSAPVVYELLGIDAYAGSTGTKQYLTFEVGSDEAVDALVERAVAQGAKLLHPPYVSVYDAYQAVLADPENNVFRLNHANTTRTR